MARFLDAAAARAAQVARVFQPRDSDGHAHVHADDMDRASTVAADSARLVALARRSLAVLRALRHRVDPSCLVCFSHGECAPDCSLAALVRDLEGADHG